MLLKKILLSLFMTDFLSQSQARRLVDEYIEKGDKVYSTQEILKSGAIPRLKEYIVRPGKVSDSIFGGKGSFTEKSTGKLIKFENPPLETKEGLPLRLMVRTQRISTHDITRGEIPFKDQILASNHNYMIRMLRDYIGTSQLEVEGLKDNSTVIAAENLVQIPFENVLRGYMAFSTTDTNMGKQYLTLGVRDFGGHRLPEGLVAGCKLPYIMDTPSTKSDEHDETVSPEQLFEMGVCIPEQYKQIVNSSLFAFGMVYQFLKGKGLMAVDTKTEHGFNTKGQIVSQDEIWTMDSSRFWKIDDYNEQFSLFSKGDKEGLEKYIRETQPGIKEEDFIVNGEVVVTPRSYSKEFARGFSKGEEGYTDEQRAKIAVRYIEGIQHLLGKRFEPERGSSKERIVSGLEKIATQLVA